MRYYGVATYPGRQSRLNTPGIARWDLPAPSGCVSRYTPLVPETKSLIQEAALRSMKRSAQLINSARGRVVDQAALIRALQESWIAGAGLDVYDPELLPRESPLLSMNNVVLSPRMAAHTEEARLRMAMVVTDVLAAIEGWPPEFPVPAPR